MKEIGIYIHIPFCAKKCNYCDFISFENMKPRENEYIQALKKEIAENKNSLVLFEILSDYLFVNN